MSAILVYASGTLGDNLPAVALGRALAARGHRVTMALNHAMAPYAEQAGLATAVLADVERGPEEARRHAWAWDHWNNPDPAAHPNARPAPPEVLSAQVRELAGLCSGADLLLATSIRAHGLAAQRATGVPWMTFSLNPYAFWRPADPAERVALRQVSIQGYRAWRERLAPTWAALGIRAPFPEWSFGWNWARHVLLASSRWFSRPDLDALQPRQSVEMTGFWFYEDPEWERWRPDPDLEAFCARRPLVLAFSSQPLEDPAAILAKHVVAAARLRVPLLVQRGWADFSERDLPAGADRSQVMFAGFLPQDWLFARACGTVQHGGIGSIARALRQGCPLLVEPFGNDQLYNASRVTLLRVGASVHPFEVTAEGIAEALRSMVLPVEPRERARLLGAQIAAEHGLGRACDLVDAFLRSPAREDGRFHPVRVPGLGEASATPADTGMGAVVPPAPARPAGGTLIPRVVHQSWKDEAVPGSHARWRASWRERNPGWEVRLWTDADNRELIARHYPWFLPIYDGYPEPIMRADAARCFVLHRHGGVYADLDCEALGPLERLLEERDLLLGLEPESHREQHFHGGAEGLPLLLTNALMASVPGHPFWEHLFLQLVRFHERAGALDATGPFLLSRAFLSWPGHEGLTLAAPAVISPIGGEESWEQLPDPVRELLAGGAAAVHHWVGTWWRSRSERQAAVVGLAIVEGGRPVSEGRLDATWFAAEGTRAADPPPLVSCLMVTRDRAGPARRAVGCFLRQTWERRELVIVDDGRERALGDWIASLGDPRLRFVRVDPGGAPLGALRNRAVAEARGELVAQWDDDDLADPLRLEWQVAALALGGAEACLLQRHQLWWPARHRLAVSCRRYWEGSFLARKSALAPYPEIRRGEDTPVIERLVASGRVAVLDAPWLYTYVFHGGNTFEEGHWETHWGAATETFEGQCYLDRIRATLERAGVEEARPGTPRGPGPPVAGAPAPAGPGPAAAGTAGAAGPAPARARPGSRRRPPRVLVLTPVRDAVSWLPRHLENLRALEWPRDRLALGFLEGDSVDGTHAWIARRLAGLRRSFARVELYRRDHGLAIEGPRWAAGLQARRRSVLARVRNELLARALRDEEWVLWLDADLVRWPSGALATLVGAGGDVVAPHCLSESTGETFDLNTFAYREGADRLDWRAYLVDGIRQPPKGFGRLYLADFPGRDIVEVDGVGGTMLLVRADLHRQGVVFPAAPYREHIETEGLACLARDMGHRCWGLPGLEVWHR